MLTVYKAKDLQYPAFISTYHYVRSSLHFIKHFCDDHFKWQPKNFKCVFAIIIWWNGKERWAPILLEPKQCKVAHKICFPSCACQKEGDSNWKFILAKRQPTLPSGLQCQLSSQPSSRLHTKAVCKMFSQGSVPLYIAVHKGGGLGIKRN